MLTAMQQSVTAGKLFAVLPEEALCWERAGLNHAAAVRLCVQQLIVAGKLPPESLHQAIAQYYRCQASYNETLARCTAGRD